MGRSEILAYFSIAFVLAISFQQAYTLKCWTCSSDNKKAQSQFCAETLDEKSINDRDRDFSFKNCTPNANEIAYCRKLTRTVENVTVYSRSCYRKPANAPKEQCFDSAPPPSFVKNLHCELCDSDGCNDATQYGPIALLFMIPIAIALSRLL